MALKPGDPGYESELDRARKDAARYRAALAPYKDVFGSFSEDEQAALLDLVGGLNESTEAGAKKFRDFAYAILGDEQFSADAPWETLGSTEPTGEEPVADEQNQNQGAPSEEVLSLTKEDLIAILDERDRRSQEAQLEQEVQSIMSEVQAAGFADGTPEQALVLWHMANETNGDLGAAVEKVRAVFPSGDEGGEEQSDEPPATPPPSDPPETSGTQFPESGKQGAPGLTGSGPEVETAKTFEEAANRALERLSAVPGE